MSTRDVTAPTSPWVRLIPAGIILAVAIGLFAFRDAPAPPAPDAPPPAGAAAPAMATDLQASAALLSHLFVGPGSVERLDIVHGVSVQRGRARVRTSLGAADGRAARQLSARACRFLAAQVTPIAAVEVRARSGARLADCSV